MDLLLGPERALARSKARALVEREIVPRAAAHDGQGLVSRELIRRVAADGWLGADVAQTYGGLGLDPETYGLVIEEFGRGCSSVRSLLTVHGMVSCALSRWGSAEQRDRFLPPFARGEELAALAVTEPESGSDLSSLATRAHETAGGLELMGKKRWITFGQIADWYLVLAASAGGPIAVMVPRTARGLEVVPMAAPLGTRGSMLAELHFESCPVPREHVLGRAGSGLSFIVGAALDHGRFTVAWGCVGIAQACLEASAGHALRRRQFGAPIVQHQLVRRMLTGMTTSVRAARLLCLHAARLRAVRHQDSVGETTVAKYFASRAAMRAATDAVQIHGASGCDPSLPVERYFRDAKVMEIIEGTNQMHELLIADLALQEAAGIER